MFSVIKEIPVFSEGLILDGNGSSIGAGDSFEVPSFEATLTVYDDDNTLSDDCCADATDEAGQTGSITYGDFERELSDQRFFVETFLRLEDSAGNEYWIAQIAYTDMADSLGANLFAFVGPAAPAGANLTVKQVTSSYAGSKDIDYDLLALPSDVVQLSTIEGQSLNYDADAKANVLTKTVDFTTSETIAESFDNSKADWVDLDFDRDHLSSEGAGEVELRINIDYHQFENLDVDRILSIDTSKLEAWLFANGATSIERIRTDADHYDLDIRVEASGFGGLGGTEREVEELIAQTAPTIDIVYRDENNSTQNAEIRLDFSTEDFPTSAIAFDLNGNGAIDADGTWIDGSGDGVLIDTLKAGSGTATDMALFIDNYGSYRLTLKDKNDDGALSVNELSNLSIWIDNGDRVIDQSELVSLQDAGITELSLSAMFGSGETGVNRELSQSVSYSLGGDDAGLFDIDAQTGVLNWATGTAPEAGNAYDVTIMADGSALESLSIEVEAPSVPTDDQGVPTREGRLMNDDADFFSKLVAYSQETLSAGFNVLGDRIGKLGDEVISDSSDGTAIFARSGNDKVYGYSGDDSIYGADGDDKLFGGHGQDILDGGDGYDILNGGKGIDVFVFRFGEGTTEIEDFELSYDILDVEGFENLTYDALTAAGQQVGDDVYYFVGEDTLILRDVELETMIEVDLCMR